MGALVSIVKSGKALYVGISNYDGETMRRAAEILEEAHCPFVINQNRYSIFDRSIEENGLKEAAKSLGKGIIAYSPLAQGMLTDRYLNGIPADSRIRTDKREDGEDPRLTGCSRKERADSFSDGVELGVKRS